MSSVRMLAFAVVAALVFINASAESLTVGVGETVTAESKAYDGITVQGTLVLPADAAASTTSRITISGGTIQLGSGAVLRANGIDVGASDSTIEFNGGKLAVVEEIKTTGAGNLDLVGAGCDVVIDHVPTQWKRIFENAAGVAGRIYVKGDNNLVINMNRTCGFSRKDSGVDGSVLLQHSGRTEINNPKDSEIYSMGNQWGNVLENSEVVLGHGANLDMSTVWHVMKKSLTGAGSVKGSYLRFEIPQAGEGRCFAQVDMVKDVVKKGNGRLDVFSAAPTNLTIEAGEVRVLPRSQLGYSEFRLKIDSVGTAEKSAMGINALALYSGESDITSEFVSARLGSYGHDAGYAANLLDGGSDSGWWYGYDVNGGSTANPSFDNAYLDVRFNDRHVVTGYKIRTRQTNSDRPKSWRLFGRDPGGEWELLDQRVNETLPSAQMTWSGMFAAAIPNDADATTRCTTLTMSSGAKLTVLSNATFACSAFAPNGGEVLDFKPGSAVDLSSEDASGAATSIDFAVGSSFTLGGAFSKSGDGTMTLTGCTADGGPEKIHVKGGTLAFRSYNSWKHWKFAFGDLDNNKGTPSGMALDEIGVFDADGNRLNVTGSVTMAALTDTSFSDWRKAMVYDGINDTLGYIAAVPNPEDESTWVYTSFSLSQSSPAVASYNLMSGGNGASNSRPKTWKVYARENTTDDWVLVDSQANIATPSGNSIWYNNGKAWTVTATQGAGAAAFQPSVPIMVDPGATLDLSYANETVFSDLAVDGAATGCGIIRGGACAAAGVVRVTVAGGLPVENGNLPLKFVDCAGTENVRDWTLQVNGVVKRNWRLSVAEDGTLSMSIPGFVIIVK